MNEIAGKVLEMEYALNTLYLLFSGALVMWMAAGFSMLEAGLVRTKNVVEILIKNICLYAIACAVYYFCGYALMYGSGNGVIPDISFFIGNEYSITALSGENAPAYSLFTDFFFQVVFVATTASIVSGAVAERMKLWPFLLFVFILSGVIYPISGYWKWGGGFLDQLGFSDFAGSGVVHLLGASASLAGVLLLGPREGKYKDGKIHPIPGSNLALSTLGMFILWLGWFGFNGGSQLAISSFDDANAVARVFLNTNSAAVGGVIAAAIVSRFLFKKTDLTFILNGALAGLVVITAEPFTPSPGAALLFGALGGALAIPAVVIFDRLKIDDPVGALSVHGVGGIIGLLLVPVTNSDVTFGAQVIGTLSIFAWGFIASIAVWFVIKLLFGIRVTPEEEKEGSDVSECGMEAYPEFQG